MAAGDHAMLRALQRSSWRVDESDIDVFIWATGHTQERRRASTLLARRIYDKLAANGESWVITRGRFVINLRRGPIFVDDQPPVQIVLRLYHSPAEVLLGFRHDDAQYYVVRLLDPVFVVGKQVATSRFEIPSEREVERVAPALEEVMAQAATELLGDE